MLLSNPKPDMKSILLKLPVDLHDDLQLVAASSGLSVTAVIRIALYDYAKKQKIQN